MFRMKNVLEQRVKFRKSEEYQMSYINYLLKYICIDPTLCSRRYYTFKISHCRIKVPNAQSYILFTILLFHLLVSIYVHRFLRKFKVAIYVYRLSSQQFNYLLINSK